MEPDPSMRTTDAFPSSALSLRSLLTCKPIHYIEWDHTGELLIDHVLYLLQQDCDVFLCVQIWGGPI